MVNQAVVFSVRRTWDEQERTSHALCQGDFWKMLIPPFVCLFGLEVQSLEVRGVE